jgi:hypothetical protein
VQYVTISVGKRNEVAVAQLTLNSTRPSIKTTPTLAAAAAALKFFEAALRQTPLP